MSLTPAQLVIFKADIESNTAEEMILHVAAGSNTAIAKWYSSNAAINYIVWKTIVTREDIDTDDAFNWGELVNLSINKLLALNTFLLSGNFNPSRLSVREGLSQIFTVEDAPITRTKLITLSKRTVTKIEKLFATGTGTNADPAQLVIEGGASLQDVRDAVALP